MSNCLVCHGEVDWQKVIQVSNVVTALDRADHYGVDALSEFEQLLYAGLLCDEHTDRNVVELERDVQVMEQQWQFAATYYGRGKEMTNGLPA